MDNPNDPRFPRRPRPTPDPPPWSELVFVGLFTLAVVTWLVCSIVIVIAAAVWMVRTALAG